MSISPEQVWGRLPPDLQAHITQELLTILQEVLHDHIRTHYPQPPKSQGIGLYSPVESESSHQQSGEPAHAVCP
jgi:hypothetical protein